MKKYILFLIIGLLLFSGDLLAEKIQYTSFFPNPLGEFKELKLTPLTESTFYTPPPASIIGTACSFPGRLFYSAEEDKMLSCNKSHFGLANTYIWGYLPGIWQYEDENVFLSDSHYTNATSLGIGVAGDEITNKLTLGYDGSIIAAGTFNAGHPVGSFNRLTTGLSESTETGTRFIWYPEKASFRVGGIQNDTKIELPVPGYDPTTPGVFNDDLGWKDANTGDHSVIFGVNNEILSFSSHSAILGGEYGRIVDNSYSVMINAPYHAFLSGGSSHDVSLGGEVVSSNGYNVAGGYGSSSIIDILTTEIDHSSYSTVLNAGIIGESDYGFIGTAVPNPGTYNPLDLLSIGPFLKDDFDASIIGYSCDSNYGTIVSAYTLMNCSPHAFIGSGSQHLLNESPFSLILGGKRHTIQGGDYSLILGGENNTAGQAHVLLDDGDANRDTVPGTHQVIGSGKDNRALTDFSIVLGGADNSAGSLNEIVGPPTQHATHATVAGGQANMAFGLMSYIGAGNQNRIGSACFDDDGDFVCDSVVGNADPCTTDSDSDGICSDIDENDTDNTIGMRNIIGDPAVPDGKYSVILGGRNNTITGDYGFIGAGRMNTITGDHSVIEGGKNVAVNSPHSWGFGKRLIINGQNSWGWNYTESSTSTITSAYTFIINNDTGATGSEPIRVGIQTLDPQATLDVVGNVKANTLILSTQPSVTGSPLLIDTATQQIGHSDLAEVFPAGEDVAPGDLVVLDKESNKILLLKSRRPYDQTIVGVVSSAPAMVFNEGEIVSDFSITPETTQTPPVALSGQVPCKVSLENGPIDYGDLLTTSSTPGHAMKATERDRSFGAVVGKAMEPFNGNTKTGDTTGTITIIVSLQ